MKFDEQEITISIMLTERCNFACAHCFYSCKKSNPPDYISNDILWKIKQQVEQLQENEFYVTINLIGGEPTIDLDQFERVLNYVGNWKDIRLEMTTNGWWLVNEDNAVRFLEIVAPYVGEHYEDSFIVRISNDDYHDKFRPKWLQGKNAIDGRISEIFEYHIFSEESICNECGSEFDHYVNECENEECGSEDIEVYYNEPDFNPPPNPENQDPAWLYVETKTQGVIPTGRGANLAEGNIIFGQGNTPCHVGDKITYRPDGTFTDFCCRGSFMGRGSVDDHPLVLLDLAMKFNKQTDQNCLTCLDDCAEWVEENWEREYNLSYDELEKLNWTVKVEEYE